MAPKGSSVAWDHFVVKDKDQYMAECKMCKTQLSFKGSVSNLTKHLKRKHPLVNLVPRNSSTSASISLNLESPSSQVATATTSSSDTTANDRLLPAASTSNTGTVRVVQSGTKTIAAYIYKKNADKCKSDIDQLIMDLFIMDFQPFRIVEDRGFRKLIQSAFPFYIIPTRKYFANNLLPSRYESLREIKMVELRNVESICITADIWTSSTNDSFLGVTGHYIDKDEYVLKSILLECVLLDGSHTSINLATELLRVAEEWQVANKILLAVSDNGSNIKKAIEKDLGWKHFGCYAHSLNLAVQEAMSKSEEVTALEGKIKTIVSYFKRSAKAWEKLKKYQEQAGKTVKRPLQSVSTRWNSIFYMMQRILEIKEEINSSLCNLNASAMSLSQFDWELCENVTKILKPFEEVTKEVSAQKYVSGSIVIPITTGLIASLENMDTSSYLETAQMFKQDLLGAIKTRFANLDRSRTFTVCMFLDPRFKLYFDDPSVAENTKQNVIQLVTAQIHKEDRVSQSSQNENGLMELQESTSTQPSTSTSGEVQISSVWQHYTQRMKNIQPKGTASSRAIIEVQRYLEDKVVLPTEKISPLQWWKQRKDVYPHLNALAITKLNAMATSVPCERLFSACGLLLNDRRTRLGTRKVQQLMFLHQNT
ncbi:E3 SUMO-protein ligase ZBED1-like [Pieris napi]|uniref:E3 SUMO-protein ligase ZBED1-like n=1 Tax=Pieris napi TaxID=78633 RepID=UPI001FB9CEE9|nr:E3 SUMO-protein ligase ZBED1-like [Pieris napi]